MPLSLAARVRPTSHALVSDLGSELVFLELDSEQYFGLDPVGKSFWERLTTSPNVETAIDRLFEEYDVNRESLARDVERLVEQLVDKGLLEVADANPP